MLKALTVYAHTVRNLRPAQWVYLPLRRVQARIRVAPSAVAPVLTNARELEPVLAALGTDCPEQVVARAEDAARRKFTFLGHTETLPHIDWRKRHVSHLWSYNLHYFDYARDLAWAYRRTGEEVFADTFEDMAESWIHGTDPGRGDGWEPYAVSLRIVNWVIALVLLYDTIEVSARRRIQASLALQAGWLERRLEYHIQANHLQKNFHALAVAGFYFAGRDAERWRRKGLRGSWTAVVEQVLPDGGHYERSPMYHAIALHDLLQLTRICAGRGEPIPPAVSERISSMVDALGILCRPNGELHLFNDSAREIAPTLQYLRRLSNHDRPRVPAEPHGAVALPDTGYFGWIDADPSGDRLIIDCGEPGPRYQPGHAHCDLLHFELDIAGRSFAVDAGVHGYEGDPYREFVRSTRAHNTVVVSDREQHELWGTFRMARRGRIRMARQSGSGQYRFDGEYSPYYDPHVVHHRSIERRPAGWRIVDRVKGAAGATLKSFLHLHPDWELMPAGPGWMARAGTHVIEVLPFGIDQAVVRAGESSPVQGWHCPAFGTALPAPVLEMTVRECAGDEFGYEIRRVNE